MWKVSWFCQRLRPNPWRLQMMRFLRAPIRPRSSSATSRDQRLNQQPVGGVWGCWQRSRAHGEVLIMMPDPHHKDHWGRNYTDTLTTITCDFHLHATHTSNPCVDLWTILTFVWVNTLRQLLRDPHFRVSLKDHQHGKNDRSRGFLVFEFQAVHKGTT